MVKSPPDPVMTAPELLKRRRISRSRLYDWARKRGLPAQRISRGWRSHRDAVDEWLRQGNQPTAADKGGAKK